MVLDQGKQTADKQSAATPSSSQAPSETSRNPLPAISLPKGGGAIRGVGEKFAVNSVTGTGSMSIPIATSPGRSGFGPQLSLSYDSGAGNGPFGFGWSLSLPSITRKTDKGLARYQDGDESDVFLISGAEDLVPILDNAGQRIALPPRTIHGVEYTVHLYRPRIEGLFARIERWTRTDNGISHWRTISRDNVTTLYGFDEHSSIVDPTDSRKTFSYLICRTFDDKGNIALYEYVAENGVGVNHAQAHESNRDATRTAQRYLKVIRYGNVQPYFPDWSPDKAETPLPEDWYFQIVLDYGDHQENAPLPTPDHAWPVRPDPFSTYRAGFEVRTYRRCERILMFHHFKDEKDVGENCLVRSTDFRYSDETTPADPHNPIYTFLESVTQTGYRRKAIDAYEQRSTPPLEFFYSQPEVHPEILTLTDADSRANFPEGLDGAHFQWVDLDGEGLSGILTEQNGAWGYKRNLSPLNLVKLPDGERVTRAQFGLLEQVPSQPASANLSGGQQLLDLSGSGQLDLVAFDGPHPGFFKHTATSGWEPFHTFTTLPHLNWSEPNLKFVDLTGDGHADVLITEDDVYTFYPSLGEDGFGEAERVSIPWDEERGPHVVFADGTQTVSLADLSGDGLSDLVRVRNGEVCYWPNLGYGHFGAKVTMDDAPRFTDEERFDPRRIHLADIDGSGTTDLLYIGDDGVQVCFNRSGNSWATPHLLAIFPSADSLSSVQVADLLGNGTACLVWSSPLPGESYAPLRYVDLMGSQKPHLLVHTRNNLGAETRLSYAPSTKSYLQDQRDGRSWITRLPFPVQVVERVETYDWIGRNRFITRYAYHHGYFDGEEREFRGFGMVEQWDTEEFAALTDDGTLPEATNLDTTSHVPPVLTKTWFHTGVYVGRDHISDFFAGLLDDNDPGEYYREPRLTNVQARALLLPDTVLPTGLTPEEEREASRALKGSMLRQEVYALDSTDKTEHPYTVAEQNFTVERLQRKGDNRHAVFFTHAHEAISYHYERNPADPRVSHTLTLEVDSYGNILKSLAVGYGRRPGQSPLQGKDQEKQEQVLITYTENDVTNAIDAQVNDPNYDPDNYRTPLPSEARSYEVTGFDLAIDEIRFSFNDFAQNGFQPLLTLSEIQYEEPTDFSKKQKRLIEHVRTLYRPDDLGVSQNDPLTLLPLGIVQSLALPGESYKLAFTPTLATQIFVDSGKLSQVDLDSVLTNEGKYVHSEGDNKWWIPSGRMFYSPGADNDASTERAYARQHFFLPHRYRDPFHTKAVSTESFVTYDGYDLLMVETRDPLGNRVTVGERNVDPTQPLVRHGHDYRVLQPALMMDPNRNRSAVAFDALGMVVGTAVMGKPEDNPVPGDRLAATFHTDLTQAEIDQFFANPKGQTAATLLDSATTRIIYDLTAYWREPDPQKKSPAFAATLARETHTSDPVAAGGLKIQVSFSYSDGFGREIQKKIQAEPGEVEGEDAVGNVTLVDTTPNVRWVGSGWTIFNNKGKPVRQYEPFFSTHHQFQFGKKVGVSPILFYDPIERMVATLHPNHTYEKVVFDPWQQTTYDMNDTVIANGTETGDPRTDPDIAGYVRGYFKTQPATWQTWHAQRIGNAVGDPERDAAQKAAAHASTPSVAHFDALGRPFMTIAYNRYERNGVVIEEKNATRTDLDIEGNQRAVRDERKKPDGTLEQRVVMCYDYDILGNRIHQASMEAGERWMLNDVTGKPIRAWDSRRFLRRMTYDELRRPTGLFVTENGVERLAERTVYGENQGDANNHRTRVYQVFDGAGIVTSVAYDFKGNLQEGRRELLPTYKLAVNWSQNPTANDGSFTSRTTYDALNRPLTVTSPDGSIYRPTFNEANLLDKVDVNLRGAAVAMHFVINIDYNAKGQRKLIEYGCGAGPNRQGVTTTYDYDENTFRLIHLKTTRPAGLNGPASQIFTDPTVVQDLRYTYDPVGNITNIADDAIPMTPYNNEQVDSGASYIYDAIYRLISAQCREHIGQTAFDFNPPDDNYRDYPFFGLHASPNDPKAVRNYTETYDYDEVGNIKSTRHLAQNGSWTRAYTYNELSLLETGKNSNRLTRTDIGNIPETYSYTDAQGNDVHGCMTSINSMKMTWDFKDQLQTVNLGGGGKAYYVYDVSGQRVRKVINRQNGTRQKERIYLGGFEIYREYNGTGGTTLKLEREALHVMDDKQRIALAETQTIENSNLVNDPVPLQRYQFGNHLGSASVELAEDGVLISYEEYHPYGTTAFQAGRSAAEVSLKRYRYTGKERDEESGFNYHGARYYAPWLGRWVSCDPVDSPEGTNRYVYVKGRPTNLIDSNGLYAEPGHFYTVFAIALASGMLPDTARRVAIFAQAPDEIAELDAASAGIAMVATDLNRLAKSQKGEEETSQQRQGRENVLEQGTYVQAGGHALTGGPTEIERTKRAEILLPLRPGTPEHGAAVHAFGDSFTHSVINDRNQPDIAGPVLPPLREQHQYEVPLGHAPHGTQPDQIELRPQLYARYATNLYKLLSLQAPGVTTRLSEKDLGKLLAHVSSLKDEQQQIETLKAFITSRGGKLDYAPEKISKLPYNQARVLPGNPSEFGEIDVSRQINKYGDWAAYIPKSNRTVEQLIDQRTNYFTPMAY